MLPHEAAALAAIESVYGAPVTYSGAGLDGVSVVAIRTDWRAAAFQGFEGKASSLSFEIQKADLPERPDKRDIIVEANGARWSPIDIDERDDVDAWVLFVEEAAPEVLP